MAEIIKKKKNRGSEGNEPITTALVSVSDNFISRMNNVILSREDFYKTLSSARQHSPLRG
jgi:hypothetical protein